MFEIEGTTAMPDRPPRLGDVIDDYCPTCRLLLNHDVASLMGDAVAKVTCRTCHNTHDYRHAQVPQRRKSKKETSQTLIDQVLAGMQPAPSSAPTQPPPPARKRRDLWAEARRIQEQHLKKG